MCADHVTERFTIVRMDIVDILPVTIPDAEKSNVRTMRRILHFYSWLRRDQLADYTGNRIEPF
jgi:hypothetical protein